MNGKFQMVFLAIMLLSLVSSSNVFTPGARRPDFNGKRSKTGKRGLSRNEQVCDVTFAFKRRL